MELAAFSR